MGDLDPSGENIFERLRDDVVAFLSDLNPDQGITFERLAITRKQAAEMNLPTAPAKTTDMRARNFDGETVQCEAIPPDVLNGIVRDAIASRIDMAIFQENLDREKQERQALLERIEGWA